MNSFTTLFAATTVAGTAIAGAACAADLMVTVRDVRSTQGIISIAVYDSAMSFLMDDAQIASADVMPMAGETEIGRAHV